MDLTKLAVGARDHAEETRRAEESDREERNRLNDATVLRRRFKELLGVDVLEADLLWDAASKQHGVIVDGVALVLCLPQYPQPHDLPQLTPKYVDEDGQFHLMDVSLSVYKITDPVALGKVLDPRRRHSIHQFAGFVYRPGSGLEDR